MSKDRPLALTGKTRVLAVFGCPVEHSLSPPMHNAAIAALGLDYIYVPFRVDIDDLPQAISGVRAMGFAGVNLTIPLKQSVAPLLDGLTENARRVGSVNTLYWDQSKLMGDSTDGTGFMSSLELEMQATPARALVLGAGGSGRAVCFALTDRGIPVVLANRTVERAESLASELPRDLADVIDMSEASLERAADQCDLIVNCTSVGMTPAPEASPIPGRSLGRGHFVYDLVYNPPETLLLKHAIDNGARGVNGTRMLVHQGAASFRLWTTRDPDLNVMEQAIRLKLSQ